MRKFFITTLITLAPMAAAAQQQMFTRCEVNGNIMDCRQQQDPSVMYRIQGADLSPLRAPNLNAQFMHEDLAVRAYEQDQYRQQMQQNQNPFYGN